MTLQNPSGQQWRIEVGGEDGGHLKGGVVLFATAYFLSSSACQTISKVLKLSPKFLVSHTQLD